MNDPSLQELLLSLGTALSPTLWLVDENIPMDFIQSVASTVPYDITAVTNRYDSYQQLHKSGIRSLLSDFDFTDLGKYQTIVYRISKEKSLAHHCINQALRHLSIDGELVLIGKKTDGIKSIIKRAGDLAGVDVRAQKRGTSYIGVVPYTKSLNLPLFDNNYAALRLVENPVMDFYSKPGAFGWDKIDAGSQLLVESLAHLDAAKLRNVSCLDLGCGWGYITLATRDYAFTRCCATDNNVAAIAATQKNCGQFKMDVDIILDDCASQIKQPFDLVLCNPPFHSGFGVSDSLIGRFLKQAHRLTTQDGLAVFVVNEFIPLEKTARQLFTRVERLAHRNGFKVFGLSQRL